MRIHIYLIVITIIASAYRLQAQTEKIYNEFDISKPAFFYGGRAEMQKFFAQNAKYPAGIKHPPKGFRVVLPLIIEKDGSVTCIRVMETPGPAFTEAALKALSLEM